MFFVKNVTFRVQTAPSDKIAMDFLEISEASIHPRPPQSQKIKRQLNIFLGGRVFIKSVMFRVQTAPFDKITIDFCRSRKHLHDSDLPGTQNHKLGPES